MNRRADLGRSRVICTLALVALAAAMALAQAQDESDENAARAYVEQQAREAAQIPMTAAAKGTN